MSISLSVDRRGHTLHLLEYSRHRGEVGKAHTIGYIAERECAVGEQHNLGLLHFQMFIHALKLRPFTLLM